MRLNQVKVYDLNAVNTTITLREIPYNPDTQKVYLYDLESTPNNIKLRYFGQTASGSSTAWTQNLSDSITLSEAIVKGIGSNKSDSITLSEALVNAIGKTLSDSLTLSDVNIATGISGPSTKISANLSDLITLSEQIAKSVIRSDSDEVTLSEEISKGIFFEFADTVILSEYLSSQMIKPDYLTSGKISTEAKRALIRAIIQKGIDML